MEEYLIKKELEAFSKRFSTEESCFEFLSQFKWKDGFVCDKCGHTNHCKGKADYSKRCTRCKKEISPTAHTLFHRCRIPLKTAFKIVYLSCKYPDISSYNLSDFLGTRRMTCYQFQKKVKSCEGDQKQKELINALTDDSFSGFDGF
ncbi:MAG: transposase [Bacteroidales bacterium]|nr:transposase [Bacteroidales bacterium]